MLHLLADHNFRAELIEGLRQRGVPVSMATLASRMAADTPDDLVLEWTAANGHILLTHDGRTMLPAAYVRVGASLPMPGVIFVPWRLDIGRGLADLELVLTCESAESLANKVHRIPLR